MITLFRKVFSHSVYRKTVYTYAVSITAVTIAVLVSVFGILSSSFKQQTVDSSKQSLVQLVDAADRAQIDIGNVMSVISGSGKTLRVVQASEENKADLYSLFLELTHLRSFYSYIENISVWNLNSQVCLQLMGDPRTGEANLRLAESVAEIRPSNLCRDIQIFQRTENVISFFRYFSYYNAGIIIDVNSDLFQYSILSEQELQREIFLIDGDGNPVTGPTKGTLGGQGIAQYLYGILSQGDRESGRLVYDDAKNQQMVFMVRSQNYDWWFCDIQEYASFYEEYQKISIVFVGGTGLFLIISTVAMLLFSKKMKDHLLRLVNKCRAIAGKEEILTSDELLYIDKTIARIDHEAYMNEQYIRSWFLKNLILGEKMPFSLSREKERSLEETYCSPYYAVLLIRLQSLQELPRDTLQEEYRIYRFTVCNLADEIFGSAYRCKTVGMEENMVAVLLLIDQYEFSQEYLLCFQQLRDFSRENLDLALSGSLGCVVEAQNEIYLSYQRAKQYMKVSNLIGKNELIDSNQISSVSYQEKNKKLVQSIKEYTRMNFADMDLSLKTVSQMFHLSTAYVGKIFKSMEGMSYASYVTNCRLEESKRLLLETEKTVQEISGALGFTNSSYFTTVFKSAYGMTPTVFRNQQT